MTAAIRTTAAGIFYEQKQAEIAVAALIEAGFRKDQIGVAAPQQPLPGIAAMPSETKAEEGGVTGVLAGGILGGLLGAGAVAAGLIPGLGAVIGAGLLVAIASGATSGAAAGGLIGALIGLGIPDEEASQLKEHFEAGKTVVTVKAGDRYDEAVSVLRGCNALGEGAPLIPMKGIAKATSGHR